MHIERAHVVESFFFFLVYVHASGFYSSLSFFFGVWLSMEKGKENKSSVSAKIGESGGRFWSGNFPAGEFLPHLDVSIYTSEISAIHAVKECVRDCYSQ